MDIYKAFIKQYGLYILVIAVVAGTLGFVATRFMPTSYDVSLAMDVNRIDDQSGEYYSYDGFYAIQAEEQFAKTVTTWFITPDFVEDVLANAGEENLDALSVKDFRRAFAAEQVSANTVEVSFGVEESDQGGTLTQAIEQAVSDRLVANERVDYEVFVGDPVIRETEYNPVFWGLGGVFFGLALAIGGFGLKEYLK